MARRAVERERVQSGRWRGGGWRGGGGEEGGGEGEVERRRWRGGGWRGRGVTWSAAASSKFSAAAATSNCCEKAAALANVERHLATAAAWRACLTLPAAASAFASASCDTKTSAADDTRAVIDSQL